MVSLLRDQYPIVSSWWCIITLSLAKAMGLVSVLVKKSLDLISWYNPSA